MQTILFNSDRELGQLTYARMTAWHKHKSSVPLHNDSILCRRCRRALYLYGGVIFIHKVVLDELDGECTFAHASSSHHHQLILCHICRCCSPHAPLLQKRKGAEKSDKKTYKLTEAVTHTELWHALLCHWTAWCSPQPLVMTKLTYYHYCPVVRNINGLCICVEESV